MHFLLSHLLFIIRKNLTWQKINLIAMLSSGGKLKHFEKVFNFKLEMANGFSHRTKKHLFGYEKLPKWASAKGNALIIYDEIVAALPGKEIAARALCNKADVKGEKTMKKVLRR